MGYEPRGIFRDRTCVFADFKAARLIADNPAAQHLNISRKVGKRCQFLEHEAVFGIGTTRAIDNAITIDEDDIAAFAQIERLSCELAI